MFHCFKLSDPQVHDNAFTVATDLDHLTKLAIPDSPNGGTNEFIFTKIFILRDG